MTHEKVALLTEIAKSAILDMHESLSPDWAREEGSMILSWTTIGKIFLGLHNNCYERHKPMCAHIDILSCQLLDI